MAISGDIFQAEMRRDGAFRALQTNFKNGKISARQAEAVADVMFDHLASQIEEARSEIRKIDAVLTRLSASVKSGKTPARGQVWRPNEQVITALSNDLKALHGWVFSLYETDMTILDFVAPAVAAATNKKVAEDMGKLLLWRKLLPLLLR